MNEMKLFYTVLYTVWDNIWIGATERGICYVLLNNVDEEKIVDGIKEKMGIIPIRDEEKLKDVRERIREYLMGKRVDFNFNLDLKGTTMFQKKVWERTRKIPYGEASSYRKIAEEIGKPHRARVVGRALALNPVPILIPCHRVLHDNGSLGGYSGGIEWKKRLLSIERGEMQLSF